ncbi:MAG TPA: hypothetical protein VFY70_03405 [Thermomicrobiales bacterium]|nr:hypothetical protein [Thermomicrobiales bacterium]
MTDYAALAAANSLHCSSKSGYERETLLTVPIAAFGANPGNHVRARHDD